MCSLNFIGFNVTVPYKTKILSLMNDVSEESAIIGAVNTVSIEDRKLIGYNTDIQGVFESLKHYKEKIIKESVTIFGAGGSSRAVIYVLIKHFKPAKIFLINRTEERAIILKNFFAEKMKYEEIEVINLSTPDFQDIVQNSMLVVNTTSIGMTPQEDESVINSGKYFNKNQVVFDLIYNPQLTKFLNFAKSANAEIINGLDMLIHQAAKSFEIWTSREFPIAEIKISVARLLAEQS
jgi:shikimate dehydrogenase